jgi:hypothetical protein
LVRDTGPTGNLQYLYSLFLENQYEEMLSLLAAILGLAAVDLRLEYASAKLEGKAYEFLNS